MNCIACVYRGTLKQVFIANLPSRFKGEHPSPDLGSEWKLNAIKL